MFVNLGDDHRAYWCNVDHIIGIEPLIQEGVKPTEPSKIVWAVTFSDNSRRGITEEAFKLIMNVSNSSRS